MKKFFCFVLLAFLPIIACFGQEFLHSSDYVYGFASDFDESKADSMAVISFARCVNLHVHTNTNYSLKETKKGIIEEFENNISIYSNVDISGIQKHVEYKYGRAFVYYYLNKKEFVEKMLLSYDENFKLANYYKESEIPHAKNLMLGYYYLAYEIASNDVFKCFYPNGKILETQVLDLLTDNYRYLGYLLSAHNVGEKNPSGVYLIRDENSKTLPGFEYMDSHDNWTTPRRFLDERCKNCDYTVAKWAYIYTYDDEYRFLFEVMTSYGMVKLDVPDEFYNTYCEYKHFF